MNWNKAILAIALLTVSTVLLSCQSQVSLPAEENDVDRPGDAETPPQASKPDYVLGLGEPTIEETRVVLRHGAWNANNAPYNDTVPVTYTISHDGGQLLEETTQIAVADGIETVTFDDYSYDFSDANRQELCGETVSLRASITPTDNEPTPVPYQDNNTDAGNQPIDIIADDTTTTTADIACNDAPGDNDDNPDSGDDTGSGDDGEIGGSDDTVSRQITLQAKTYDDQPSSVRMPLLSPDLTQEDSFNAVITYNTTALLYDGKVDNLVSGDIDVEQVDDGISVSAENIDKGTNTILTTLRFNPQRGGDFDLTFTEDSTINGVANQSWFTDAFLTLPEIERSLIVGSVSSEAGSTVNVPISGAALGYVDSFNLTVDYSDDLTFESVQSNDIFVRKDGDQISWSGDPRRLTDEFMELSFSTPTLPEYDPQERTVSLSGRIGGAVPSVQTYPMRIINRTLPVTMTIPNVEGSVGETVQTNVSVGGFRCITSTTLNIDADDGVSLDDYTVNLPSNDGYQLQSRFDDNGDLRVGWLAEPNADPVSLANAEALITMDLTIQEAGEHTVQLSDDEQVGPTSTGGCVLGSDVDTNLFDGMITGSN